METLIIQNRLKLTDRETVNHIMEGPYLTAWIQPSKLNTVDIISKYLSDRVGEKALKREQRRQQIIDRAMEVFIKNGYKGATTARLAEAAGISEVTLFRYFSSKQEIFLAGVKPIFVETLMDTIHVSEDYTPKEKIRYLLHERLAFISKNHELIKLILRENDFLETVGSADLLTTIVESFKVFMKDLLIDGKKEQLVLRLIMGSILSFLYLPEPNQSDIEIYVNQLTDILVKEMR